MPAARRGGSSRQRQPPEPRPRQLHAHPNTVTYRLRRIEEITGLRLDIQRDRLMAEVALEIMEGVPS